MCFIFPKWKGMYRMSEDGAELNEASVLWEHLKYAFQGADL